MTLPVEQRFRAMFEECADELFQRSLERLKDRKSALRVTHVTFQNAWREVAVGKKPRNQMLFSILDELLMEQGSQNVAYSSVA